MTEDYLQRNSGEFNVEFKDSNIDVMVNGDPILFNGGFKVEVEFIYFNCDFMVDFNSIGHFY